MIGQRAWWVVGRRGVCTAGQNEKREYRKPSEVPIRDPSYFWIESHDCGRALKTWREIEEEYACAIMIRFSQKVAPERRLFNLESGDLYICRRGCLHPCIPPPCFDPEYPSVWEKNVYRLTRLTAVIIFLGLVYASEKLQIWGPTGPTLDTILGDSDSKIDQLSVIGTLATKWWNAAVAITFSGISWAFPATDREPEFDERDFILTVKEDLKERKDREAAGRVKEDENVFEDWELVYNYVPEKPKLEVEVDDESDWLWMEHKDPDYVKPSKAPMPYEKSARMLTRLRDQVGVTLASIYTDLCSEWTVTKGSAVEDIEFECFETSPLGQICKRKRERKKKVRINPNDCNTCPYMDQDNDKDKKK